MYRFSHSDSDSSLTAEAVTLRPGRPNAEQAVMIRTSRGVAVYVVLDRLEELFAGIRAEAGQPAPAARQATGQADIEAVPTPEEGIEDARKAMQHVLQLFLDRVPRDELDAETMADSLADALSDGLTELYRTAARAETAAPVVGQPAAAPADEAHLADITLIVQRRGAAGWLMSSTHYDLADRDQALACLARRRKQFPNNDHRLVRETTTWTVEDVEPGTWVPQYGRPLTPEEQAAETLAAADTVEDETR
ncbi:hypothetical protein [Streptomyces sp. NPDC126503]|uniref:hypothetical protein n=1 Tax=Streptomyces sp. NPDC126503 TaxID=3155315 RepID=UPI00332433D0